MGRLIGKNYSYADRPIQDIVNMNLETVIASYFYDGYDSRRVNSYLKTVEDFYQDLEDLANGREFYDKKEKTLYFYPKELPLSVRTKLIEKYGENWDAD